jgi:hypothetical protein
MQMDTKSQTQPMKSIPNPRGTQTVPQPRPVTPRSPDGRFAPEFRPLPAQTKTAQTDIQNKIAAKV